MLSDIYHKFIRFKTDAALRRRSNSEKSELSNILNEKQKYKLFITNNHFGGTRDYEKNSVIGSDAVVLRREGYYSDDDKYFEVSNNGNSILISIDHVFDIWNYHFSKITVSTLIDFDNILRLLSSIIEYKQNHTGCVITYLVHDFHCICPNCNLFVNGQYCSVNCSKYRCSNFQKFSGSIDDWRNIWGAFFSNIDEIRCFSNSSRDIIAEVYESAKDRITVVPHDLSYCKNTKINGVNQLPLHIGVVGTVFGPPKGKQVVSNIIDKFGNSIRITLIGSPWWRFPNFKRKVNCLGPYKRDKLQSIIEKKGISFVLFPSLWPETFSYLVSELIMMDIPLACFNLGAQAEKVKNYDRGIVVDNELELWALLDELNAAGTWNAFVSKHSRTTDGKKLRG